MSAKAVAGWVVAAAVVAGAAFWAGTVVASPPTVAEEPPAHVAYGVTDGEVGQSQRFTAQTQWPVVGTHTSPASGTVTSIDLPEDGTVAVGTVLYTVDMRPVVAVGGAVPAYRELAAGARGPDVAQLQQFLVEVRGAGLTVDGRFGAGTTAAVRAWQGELGVAADGVVRLGDVVFLPELPARMVRADGLVVGRSIAQGDEALQVVAPAPEVVLQLSIQQVNAVPPDSAVVALGPAGELPGVIVSTEDQQDGTVLMRLATSDGGPLCGDDCAWVPLPGPTNLSVEVVVVPAERGPVVPVAAVTTRADGSTWVDVVGRGEVQVQVRAGSSGLLVVSGVESGDEVLIPAGAP